MRGRLISFLSALLIIAIAMFLVICLSDSPIIPSGSFSFRKSRCVIAIRDNVVQFQKFGTRLFTEPYLNSSYDKVYYFTQYDNDNKKESFINALDEALDNYSTVDIFLLAHGNSFYEWLDDIDTGKLKRIRMVYNTGCSGSSQHEIWMQKGVGSYVSHKGPVSISPLFYFFFLRRYISCMQLEQCVSESNTMTKNVLEKIGNVFNYGVGLNQICDDTEAETFGLDNFNIDSE